MRTALNDENRGKQQQPEQLAEEILHFWLDPLDRRDWPERLSLIERIDEEIREVCRSPEIYRRVSQTFTAMLLERLSNVAFTCEHQAYVYLNSANVLHRQAALAWLVLNQPNTPLLCRQGAPHPFEEKRAETRLAVNLPGVITTNDNRFEGQLVDISRGGARMKVESTTIACGDRVDVVVSLLGQVAATVVWIASTCVGLAFVDSQFPILAG